MQRIKVKVPLAVLRARHGKISQQALARQVGLSQKAISALETGKSRRIDLRTIERLCEVFDILPNELFEVEVVEERAPAGQPIAELGWSPEEAGETRARLAPFEADWDAPGMEAYDAL